MDDSLIPDWWDEHCASSDDGHHHEDQFSHRSECADCGAELDG